MRLSLADQPVTEAAAAPLLAVRGLAKSYGGARALVDASLEIASGEVHGLVGANGAGKSTLIRCLAGLERPDGGVILIDGRPVGPLTTKASAELGLGFIHQELAFVPGMTVIENVMLGLPKRARLGLVDWRAIAREVRPVAERVGLTAPLGADVRGLSTAEKWLISIVRAQMRRARLIVMDEPTASLSAREAGALFGVIRDLAAAGTAVLYVSHRLGEILDLCARVTVLRDGRSVAQMAGPDLARERLVAEIVGGTATEAAAKVDATRPEVALAARGLARAPRVGGVSFELRRGEVLGIGGLVGAGRTELARLLFGADAPEAGTMKLMGRPYAPRSPAQAVRAGVGLVPEERRAEALVLPKSIAFNLSLANLGLVVRPWPWVSARRREALALRVIRDLGVRAPSPETPVGRLSGGNQQKVAIGRWLLRAPEVLILDEPTRGVDVGARAEIHRLVRALAAGGTAVLVISSEPDELPDLADRVLVMAEGRLVAELKGAALTRAAIVTASYGAAPSDREIP